MGGKPRSQVLGAAELIFHVRCVYCQRTKTVVAHEGMGSDDLPLCAFDGGIMLVYGAVRRVTQ